METLNLLSSIETHLLSLLLVVCLFSVKDNILSTWFKPEIWLPFSHSHMESAPKPLFCLYAVALISLLL